MTLRISKRPAIRELAFLASGAKPHAYGPVGSITAFSTACLLGSVDFDVTGKIFGAQPVSLESD